MEKKEETQVDEALRGHEGGFSVRINHGRNFTLLKQEKLKYEGGDMKRIKNIAETLQEGVFEKRRPVKKLSRRLRREGFENVFIELYLLSFEQALDKARKRESDKKPAVIGSSSYDDDNDDDDDDDHDVVVDDDDGVSLYGMIRPC